MLLCCKMLACQAVAWVLLHYMDQNLGVSDHDTHVLVKHAISYSAPSFAVIITSTLLERFALNFVWSVAVGICAHQSASEVKLKYVRLGPGLAAGLPVHPKDVQWDWGHTDYGNFMAYTLCTGELSCWNVYRSLSSSERKVKFYIVQQHTKELFGSDFVITVYRKTCTNWGHGQVSTNFSHIDKVVAVIC